MPCLSLKSLQPSGPWLGEFLIASKLVRHRNRKPPNLREVSCFEPSVKGIEIFSYTALKSQSGAVHIQRKGGFYDRTY